MQRPTAGAPSPATRLPVVTAGPATQRRVRTTEEIQADSLESLRNSRRLAEEAKQIGCDTMGSLLHQREQLERADGRITDINNNLEHAERDIRGIDSWCVQACIEIRR